MLQERATSLMIGIITYLPVAMSYLCRDAIRKNFVIRELTP
jgi:hypothetical protein